MMNWAVICAVIIALGITAASVAVIGASIVIFLDYWLKIKEQLQGGKKV